MHATEFICNYKHIAGLKKMLIENPAKNGHFTFRSANVFIDFDSLSASVNLEPVHLKPLHFSILRLLAENANAVITYEEIFAGVWGCRKYYNYDSLKAQICQIRKQLKTECKGLITNIYGVGYRLNKIENN